MATRLSPAANLLRKSRLFSLPTNLPPPARPLTAEPSSWSETATQVYPTHQAIVTPSAAAARGDWGLKRPLPAKSTIERSSNPIVRINSLDTLEHITDFDSAADHTRTLEKFLELELAISRPKSKGRQRHYTDHVSVFEEDAALANCLVGGDRNTPSTMAGSPAVSGRYRFNGPWIAGLSEAEFNEYLKQVSKRKDEFLNFLRKRYHAQITAQKRQSDIAQNGTPSEAEASTTNNDVPFSEDAFQEWLRMERMHPRELPVAMKQFLDFAPPMMPGSSITGKGSFKWDTGPSNVSTPAYAHDGPPQTHPSAGLSYLRTNSRILNHPSLGPQKDKPTVAARNFRSTRPGPGGPRVATGVAGFIADDSNMRYTDNYSPALEEMYGGPKMASHVQRAWIASDGRVSLKVAAATSSSSGDADNRPAYTRGKNRQMGSFTSGLKETARSTSRPSYLSTRSYADELLNSRP